MTPAEQQAYDTALELITTCARENGTTLDLKGMGLISLPPEIGQCASLSELFLQNNQLSAVPPEIGQCVSLFLLNLSKNQLRSVPSEIGQCAQLSGLFLSRNQLSTIPSEIAQCSNLSRLSLWRNQLSTIPLEIWQCPSLAVLYLSNNQLSYIPPEIGDCASLSELALSNNQLSAIPPEMGQCAKLSELDLSHNQLSALPREIGQCASLSALYLHNNPTLDLPLSILGPQAFEVSQLDKAHAPAKDILEFYFSRLAQGERPLNEVKLLLLGRGEAGKTSVSRALRGEVFSKEQGETPGIEIVPWTLKCPQEDEVRVHLWDFAGQEITHETHRFFLTERSLYLVVLDGRGGQQMEEAEYWLSHVVKYGSHREGEQEVRSPVIVVLNKWRSPGPYDVERRRLQREYPNILAFVETDCAPVEGAELAFGIQELRETIRAALERMPAVRQKWPLSYFNVRKLLGRMVEHEDASERRHFLRWEDFREICVDCGVIEQERQVSMAENLNALGVALYYGDDARLRDTRVLNPNWAANGLYALVRGVQRLPWKGKRGQLWAGELAQVLKEGLKGMSKERGATADDYPGSRHGVPVHEFLLDLMQDRELGFLTKTVSGKPLYILPGLLPLDEPEVADYDLSAHMEGAEVRFRYLYELLPAGVMSRFIVRTHALSEDFHRWQRGVVLGWGGARALLMAERRRNPRVDVYIIGGTAGERQELAGVVRSNMEVIHHGLPEGLRGEEELDLNLPGDQYESVEKLERLEEAHQPVQVVTKAGPQSVEVTPQLEQVQPAKARRKGAPKLKVFVSYAHANYKLWERMKTHLDILKNENQVSVWFDGKIRPGSEWDDAIRTELKQADIVILLLSNAFFASKYINGVELKEARRRHGTGEATLLPVLLEPSEAFSKHKWLNKLQAVPSVNGSLRPITSFNPAVNGWNLVDKALRSMIEEIAAQRPPEPSKRALHS
ncbi:MAG: COR domain-containing protein [Verrucomicrobiota bacterium]